MIRINLAPLRERQAAAFSLPGFRLRLNLGVLVAALAVAIVVVLGGFASSLLHVESRLTAEIESTGREITNLRTVVGPAAKLKENLAELRARLTAIETLTRDQTRPLTLIDAFVDTVPADLWITGFEENGIILRVTGGAYSATAVSNLMTALRASGRFKEVDIVISRRDLDKAPNMLTFEVTGRFEV